MGDLDEDTDTKALPQLVNYKDEILGKGKGHLIESLVGKVVEAHDVRQKTENSPPFRTVKMKDKEGTQASINL